MGYDLKTQDFLVSMQFEETPSLLEPCNGYVIVTWMYDKEGKRVTDMAQADSGIRKFYQWNGTLFRTCDLFQL